MRLSIKFLAAILALLAVFVSSLRPTIAGGPAAPSQSEALVGVWKPGQADAGWALLVFDRTGRFSMLAVRAPQTASSRFGADLPSFPEAIGEPEKCGLTLAICSSLETLGGSWTLGIDGGEVVLTFDRWKQHHPNWTRYMTLLLVGDELRPYPGMRGRSPIASTSWLRVDKGFGRRFGM